jgi:tetratricopeptide (TPR) repeat protein
MRLPLPHSRRAEIGAAGLLLLLLLFAYGPTLSGHFLNWDDDRFFVNNPLWHGPIGDYVMACFTRVQFQAYHPLHLLSYLPDRLFWPDDPAGFHRLNLLIFAIELFFLLALLRRRVSPVAAWLAVALVGLHPLLVEPVAWITGRKDLLALVFILGVLWVEDRSPEQQRFSWLTLWLSVLASLTKTSAVVLPLLVFAWQRWVRGRPLRLSLVRALPPLVPALLIAWAVPQLWADNQMLHPRRPLSVWLDVPGTFAVYAARVVWPLDLSPAYPAVSALQVPGAVLWYSGLAAALLGWRRLSPPARFALVAFFGSLLPVSNLVPLYFRFADRYVAIALVALAWPCARMMEAARARVGRVLLVMLGVLAVAVVAGEAALTRSVAAAWRDSESLWTRAVRVQPEAFYAQVKLGETLRGREQWTGALACYIEAIKIDPRSALGYFGLFATSSERAERSGQIPAGRSAEWLRQLDRAVASPRDLASLVITVQGARCAPCAHSLLWLALRLYPPPDGELLARARASLDAGRVEEALVYLLSVKDRGAQDFARLYQEARSHGRYPFE